MKFDKASYSVSSYFVIPISLVLLGLLAFIATAASSKALAGFAIIAFVLMAALRLNGRLGLARLHANFSLDAHRLFRGDEFSLSGELSNAKLLPVWITLSLAHPEAISALAKEGLEGECSLLPFEKITGTWRFKAERRGVYRLGPATLSAGDILDLYRRERRIALGQSIIVYPRIHALTALDLPFREYLGSQTTEGIVEDPAWYEGTREYTGGKSARAIHWKASARLNQLQEKIFQPSMEHKVMILVDGEGFAKAEDSEGFEYALEMAASLASFFSEEGAFFSIATDRKVEGFSPSLPLGRGPDHLGMCLELLARCSSSHRQAMLPLIASSGSQGSGYLIIAREGGDYVKKYLHLAFPRKDRVFFVFAQKSKRDGAAALQPCTFFDAVIAQDGLELEKATQEKAIQEAGAQGDESP